VPTYIRRGVAFELKEWSADVLADGGPATRGRGLPPGRIQIWRVKPGHGVGRRT